MSSNIGGLSPADLSYFRARQKNRVYETVIKAFRSANISKAEIARRLNRKPEQITRWLSGPGNWTLDTVSDLLLSCGKELAFTSLEIDRPLETNYIHPLAEATSFHQLQWQVSESFRETRKAYKNRNN